MQKWSIFILIALLFASCADLKKSEQLERIDAMESQLSEWKSSLEKFDESQWNSQVSKADSTVVILKKLEADTISLTDAVSLDTYRQVQAKLMQLQVRHTDCTKGLNEITQRLKKLRSDINSGNGQRHKYDAFIEQEEEQVTRLEEEFQLYNDAVEEIEVQFPQAQKDVNRIIAERLPQTAVQ